MNMDKFYPFNAVTGDRRHDADDLAVIIRSLITNGVEMVNASDLQVLAAGSFNVTVKAGTCVINGRIGISIADKTLAVAAPTAGMNRIDRIVARADFVNRLVSLEYVQGTPGSTPTAPALLNTTDAFDLPLARITVNNNTAAITQAMITDERILCGVLIPNNLEALYTQLTSKFNAWFATVQDTLDGDTAGHLLNLITGLQTNSENINASINTLQQNDVNLNTLLNSRLMKTSIISGSVSISVTAGNTVSAEVLFPTGYFSAPPKLAISIVTVAASLRMASVGSISAERFLVYAYSTSNSTVTIHYIAHLQE